MKKLKLFEEFTPTQSDSIEQDCIDILQELTDVGYDVTVKADSLGNIRKSDDDVNRVLIIIKKANSYTYDDIKIYIEQLTSYLNGLGFIVVNYDAYAEVGMVINYDTLALPYRFKLVFRKD